MACCKKEYNFDEIIDRRQHHSKKWTDWSSHGLEVDDETLALWIADMDFRCEDSILKSLHETVDYGIIGYDAAPKDYYEPFIKWKKERFNWNLKEEWFLPCPGIVPGISNAVLAMTEPGDKILIQTPVYYPFFSAINVNKRNLVENVLLKGEDKYEIDFKDFEEKIKECKMMILCNPHNPIGRVYTESELRKMGELCVKYNVIIISDEIHCDLIMKDYKHISIATLSKDIADITVTMTAPSKTFNIAGLAQSVAIISNPKLHEQFDTGLKAFGLMHMSAFGITGFNAAYKYGEEWLDSVMEYIEGNIDYVYDYITKNIPKIKLYRPEGTFLMWLDLSEISNDEDKLEQLIVKEAKILMDQGSHFGDSGKCHYRLNVASPKSVIEEAMKRLDKFINK